MSIYKPTEKEVKEFTTYDDVVAISQDGDLQQNPAVMFETQGCGCCAERIVLTEANTEEIDRILDKWERRLEADLARIELLRNTLKWHGFEAMREYV